MKRLNLIGIILAFFAGIGMGYVAIMAKIKPAIKDITSDLVDDVVDNIYPCKLIATIRFGQSEDRTLVDMSHYDSKGVIGITIDKKEKAETAEEEELDGEPTLYPTAVVYRLGASWLWKVL